MKKKKTRAKFWARKSMLLERLVAEKGHAPFGVGDTRDVSQVEKWILLKNTIGRILYPVILPIIGWKRDANFTRSD